MAVLLSSDRSNVPVALAPLIGREREASDVARLILDDEIRLVTLTGPGGVGKTRLALHVASEAGREFAAGAVFISLVSVRDPNLVLPEIARVLEVPDAGERALPVRLRAVLGEQEVLLVLDNLEHVVEAVPDLSDLLATCPRLKILATSREVLRIRGEHEYPVPPLGLPVGGRQHAMVDLERHGAIALFTRQARAAKPMFALSDDNAAVVTEICVRLDGLPLAIELAAARINVLSPEELLARLNTRLSVLVHGPRDLPARQQTMRKAIAWSYDLLTPDEQGLFRRLSVFAGGFTMETAELVVAPSEANAIDLLEGVTSLVEKSLLREDDRSSSPRFVMLETVREFAAEQLVQHGDAEHVRRRHALWFRDMVERARPELMAWVHRHWLAKLEIEHVNIRAAMSWAMEQGEAETAQRLGYALGWYWYVTGQLSEGRGWTERSLTCEGASTVEARVATLIMAGWLAGEQGDLLGADPLLAEGIHLARATNQHWFEAQALFALGLVDTRRKEFDRARAYFEEALAIYERLGERMWLPFALKNIGFVAYKQGDYPRADALFQEALAFFRDLGNTFGTAITLINMAKAARERGDLARATDLYTESLALRWDFGDELIVASCLRGLALVAASADQFERAALLFGAVETVRAAVGSGVSLSSSDDRALKAVREALGEEAFTSAWTSGRALSLNDAVTEALAAPSREAESATESMKEHSFLTAREMDILRLLALGHSNPEIAEALFISRRTVTTHITNLFAKLGVANRTEAVGLAHRRGFFDATTPLPT